ncbi:spore coat associated protein CotJA [Clostridium sp. E02]|uniref:spore coat associated protein CotJA n=1 Tax=Clostridium sp. E02 TaxID=2487134 RepID=UPI0013DDDD5A|nr:spore coat associated protein CotJA [Clostridium sp. E02]
MDCYTKQRNSDWASDMGLDTPMGPGTVIRPDMPLGSGPARTAPDSSPMETMSQQGISPCTYMGRCPERRECHKPMRCPDQGVSPAPMKCPEKPVCYKPMRCPDQGVSPAPMKCPEKPVCCKPMRCPDQGVSPAPMKCPEKPVCCKPMRCPEKPVCGKPMRCPDQGVSPAMEKWKEMPPCSMKCPDMTRGAAPQVCPKWAPAANPCSDVNDIERFPVGMTYVPWQHWQDVYAMDVAINMGTIFPDLFQPFLMGGCRR